MLFCGSPLRAMPDAQTLWGKWRFDHATSVIGGVNEPLTTIGFWGLLGLPRLCYTTLNHRCRTRYWTRWNSDVSEKSLSESVFDLQ